jgi:hypothetical protein
MATDEKGHEYSERPYESAHMKPKDLVGNDPLKNDHEQDKDGVASLDLQLELARLVSKC